ncbi:MAG: hypothetical protein MJH10_09240 [Epibacterium sp.]|nr:hypothetical protein [Epibacterium sp.]NQX73719.1 hypothetical protein [Epibacterium sp.]
MSGTARDPNKRKFERALDASQVVMFLVFFVGLFVVWFDWQWGGALIVPSAFWVWVVRTYDKHNGRL